MKNILLYFALFFLVVLLLLPVGLRIFAKDLYKKSNNEKQTVSWLTCNKTGETVSSTFLNGAPYNFKYKIKGKYLVMDSNENESNTADELNLLDGNYDLETEKVLGDTNETETDNNIVYDLQKYASITYDENEDISTFTLELNKYQTLPSELSKFKNLDSQKNYLSELGFSCMDGIN